MIHKLFNLKQKKMDGLFTVISEIHTANDIPYIILL